MTDERNGRRAELHAFLRTIQRAGRPAETLGDADPLVPSGLIDSLAVLQIVTWLETTHGVDFSARGIDPEQLGTIGGILDVIEGEGGGA